MSIELSRRHARHHTPPLPDFARGAGVFRLNLSDGVLVASSSKTGGFVKTPRAVKAVVAVIF
jgi:hypothetical protein